MINDYKYREPKFLDNDARKVSADGYALADFGDTVIEIIQ